MNERNEARMRAVRHLLRMSSPKAESAAVLLLALVVASHPKEKPYGQRQAVFPDRTARVR